MMNDEKQRGKKAWGMGKRGLSPFESGWVRIRLRKALGGCEVEKKEQCFET